MQTHHANRSLRVRGAPSHQRDESGTRKLRVAIVAPPWVPVPPRSYGGTEAVIDELATGLAADGHDVHLATVGDSTCPVPRWSVYDCAQRDAMGDVGVELRHVIRAYEDIGDVDIIHDHTVSGPALAASGRLPTPVVTTNHNPFTIEARDRYRAFGDLVPVIAISHHHASTAGEAPVSAVIHHGVDVGRYPFGAGDGGYVLSLGRMAADKGIDIAARAARAAGIPLVIAAKMREPGEHEYFQTTVRPLLGDGVEYVGEVGSAEKLELLAGAVALVNPIRWHEPFGMVMIEAMSCGTPVLAFPNGSAPEIVDHGRTGFLCADEADLVGRMGVVDQLSRSACRVRASRHFSTRRMVGEHVAFYREVIAENRSINLAARPPLAAISA